MSVRSLGCHFLFVNCEEGFRIQDLASDDRMSTILLDNSQCVSFYGFRGLAYYFLLKHNVSDNVCRIENFIGFVTVFTVHNYEK